MEENKRIISCVLIICILIFGSLAIPYFTSADDEKTAMDKKIIADEYAKNWDENATLVGLYYHQGKSYDVFGFTFYYTDEYIFTNSTNQTRIVVYQNNTIKNEPGYIGVDNSNRVPIHNWSIDSDQLWRILQENETFNEFLIEAPDPSGRFNLEMYVNTSTPIWNCSISQLYCSGLGFDIPCNRVSCDVIIDANTGEILEIQWEGQNPNYWVGWLCCTSSLIIIVLIMYFSMKRRKKSQLMAEDFSEYTLNR